jgi:hypothetical protein
MTAAEAVAHISQEVQARFYAIPSRWTDDDRDRMAILLYGFGQDVDELAQRGQALTSL